MNDASLIWITPEAEKMVGYIARVSNPKNQDNPNIKGLLKYMIKHKHWSPFEMANACFEVNTTRDIARQILRHRSCSFQELSLRYSEKLQPFVIREARLQDLENRQNSLELHFDDPVAAEFTMLQKEVAEVCERNYQRALELGIAKEQARAMLPEGMTHSRMYIQGSIRSWMHYCELRCGVETQKEHREVANSIWSILQKEIPIITAAMDECRMA